MNLKTSFPCHGQSRTYTINVLRIINKISLSTESSQLFLFSMCLILKGDKVTDSSNYNCAVQDRYTETKTRAKKLIQYEYSVMNDNQLLRYFPGIDRL